MLKGIPNKVWGCMSGNPSIVRQLTTNTSIKTTVTMAANKINWAIFKPILTGDKTELIKVNNPPSNKEKGSLTINITSLNKTLINYLPLKLGERFPINAFTIYLQGVMVSLGNKQAN